MGDLISFDEQNVTVTNIGSVKVQRTEAWRLENWKKVRMLTNILIFNIRSQEMQSVGDKTM